MGTITDILHQAYIEIPEKPAIRLLYNQQPEEILTYAGLLRGAFRYTRLLEESGVKPGEVVILIFNHGKDLVYSFLGAILQGAIPSIMPFLTEKLSPDQYRASLRALFEITQPAAVITYPEFLHEIITASEKSSIRVILTSDQVKTGGLEEIPWESLGGCTRSPDDIVLLQHSSGTTGLQKGVALSHQAVLNQVGSYARAIQMTEEDVIVSWLPLYHDMGLIAGFLLPVLFRVSLVLMSPFDWVRQPARLMQAVSKYRGTLAWLPNFAYNFCAQKIRERDLQGVDLSSWRAVINCSEPMHWKSHQMFLERFQAYGFRPEALATCYAMAENVFAVTQGGIGKPVIVDEIDGKIFFEKQEAIPAAHGSEALKMLSAGMPIEQTQVKIIDAHGHDLPERCLGEIALRSNCMLTGYYHRPDATEKSFLKGWYLTGDLGYMAKGEVYVTGRKKDLIIVGGKNVYPQDLERLAGDVEGVHPGRIVAFGYFNETAGTEDVVIVAEVEGSEGKVNQEDEAIIRLSDAIRRKVTQGSDIALRNVYLVGKNWLLKTSSGKIARAANRDKWLTEQAASQG
jgi:fatty-acyl-CoA synthase